MLEIVDRLLFLFLGTVFWGAGGAGVSKCHSELRVGWDARM